MLRDVFYFGEKPNVHPREKFVVDLADARSQATTEHFWIINEFCDYRGFDWDFDFEFLPDEDVWAAYHINIWPSQHQKDSGTWLVNTDNESPVTIYRNDVDVVTRKNIKSDNWIELDLIDHTKFDFSWHPDPTDPPYIYKWGCKFFPSQIKHVLEYRVQEATQVKYLEKTVELLPNDYWIEHYPVDKDYFDFTWRPDPMDPPFIYIWGNKYIDGKTTPTLEYHTPNATECKYLPQLVTLLPQPTKFQHLEQSNGIDYSWIPDPTAPPYIYVWGNQWNKPEDKISIQYVVEGATEYKYMEERAIRKPCMDNWFVPNDINTTGFDFSWEPSPADPPFIYEFGTQHQKTGGPRYVVPGAVEVKYMDLMKAKALPTSKHWIIPKNIDIADFDFSWHPDNTDPLYIYQFGTQWALSGGPRYVVPEAKEIKYMDNMTAKALPDKTNWEVPAYIDIDSFDFSWHPYAEDEPYIYQFGTQWQKTGGPRYITPGTHKNSAIKYIDTRILKANRLPNKKAFAILNNLNIKDFDYSWHPDTTEEPFIYIFGNNFHPGEVMPTIEYVVSGAKQIKYVNDTIATLGADRTNWVITQAIDESKFDFSWKPNPKDPPYIYRWGNKYISNKYKPTIEYHVPGATDIKYMDDTVEVLPEMDRWEIPAGLDVSEFDFRWRPDPLEPDLIWQFGTQWQKTGGPRYVSPGATTIKYIDTQKAKKLPNKENWVMPDKIRIAAFDYSWHPDATEQPYVYQFGTQWQLTGGPKYVVPEAIGTKYIDPSEIHAIAATDMSCWDIPEDIDRNTFDFSWHPHPDDPDFIYEFGTQHQKNGGPKYIPNVPDSEMLPTKYIDTRILKAKRFPNNKNFAILNNYKIKDFDYSWHPDVTEEQFIYVFGNQWHPPEVMPTVEYVVPGAKQIKYITNITATLGHDLTNWEIPNDIDTNIFDFSWKPNPKDPPYIYEFGTQHQKTGGPRYIVEGATEYKYINFQKAKALPTRINWEVPTNINVSRFDFSWHPDRNAPPYIYQFGTIEDPNDGPRYITPGNMGKIVNMERVEIKVTEVANIERVEIEVANKEYNRYVIKTTLEDLVNEHPNEIFWALNSNLDYSGFDFDWRPSIEQATFVQVFGLAESQKTQTYFVNAKMWLNGNRELNFVEKQTVKNADMFFVDKGNSESQERFDKLKQKFSKIQKTRYLNSWVDTINRCINRSSTNLCWILNSELDYTNFDFNYYPNPWQMKMVHVFGTQWSHWGTTYMVNRDSFSNDTKHIKIIEHLSNLNFVKDSDKRAKATRNLYDIFVIDHGNKEMFKTFRTIQSKADGKSVNSIDYKNNYLDTFKEILTQVADKKENFIWVCSSICDYAKFDFTYICDPFAREQLHVFPSATQKYGDTFLVNVNKLRELMENMNTLQEYNKINFNRHMSVTRYPAPEIISDDDTHTASLDIRFDYPYVVLITQDNKDVEKLDYEPLNLWSNETKNIVITSNGATRIVVPKEVKDVVKREFYDYPYIVKSSRLAKSKPLDIVFLSNGEKCADENYEHLLKVTNGLNNRIVRVDGVNGRVNAYHAAANASETPWMFTVFAKLKVSNKFDWNWQPDRLQVPKHYVFHAKNPVNGLVYGHQAMIAYNKKMTLNNAGRGLDFTQDDLHEVLNINSGVANFNVDEWTTWRTAFRECIKLCTFADDISNERLKVWTTVANGEFAQYCLDGANDAVNYFDEVAGDYDALKLSYDWAWLKEQFIKKYKK